MVDASLELGIISLTFILNWNEQATSSRDALKIQYQKVVADANTKLESGRRCSQEG